jgi:integrase
MGQVNYYLKKAEPSGLSLIYLQYLYHGKKLTFSFGETIPKKSWNRDKQRVKSNKTTTQDGKHSLNDLLDSLEKILIKAYNNELKNGVPAPDKLKQYLSDFMNQNEDSGEKDTLYSLIERFIKKEIKHKGKSKSESTVRVYRSTLNHLKEYQGITRTNLDFDSITINFYHRFIDFLENRATKHEAAIEGWRLKHPSASTKPIMDLGPNTIGKYIAKLKVFMKQAVILGYTSNVDYMKFDVPKEETDAVYLTETELEKLYNYDFSNNKRLERVRDLFIFGAWTGLRYQDFSTIKSENKVLVDGEWFLKVFTQKTGELAIIPCAPVVLEIFEKYGANANALPHSISNQNFNDYIKEACKIVGFTEKGRLITKPELPLYKCISSHTCRRSMATNFYLDGFPTIDLMKITTHKSEKSFLSYIKVSKLDTAKRLSQHIKKRWSEKMLRVA